jgi:hypothetical protein
MYEMARNASVQARELEPGKVISSEGYGDDKRSIDQVAEDAITTYIDQFGPRQDFSFGLKPEDASWG